MNPNMSTQKKPSVLLISIDAVNPDFLMKQKEKGVKLSNITELFLEQGLCSQNGMKSIFPTFTYPCHQSMITGTSSAAHGIYNNIMFDPEKEYKNAWYWFVSDHVKTLWEEAHDNGYISASVAFPVSVGAPCDYVIPEFWYCRKEIDQKFINAVSYPRNLLKELYDELNIFPTGAKLLEDSDVVRYKATRWVMENKIAPHMKKEEKPFFLSTYFASYDETTHQFGVGSDRALRALEEIDEMVGDLVKTASAMADGNLVVCVVSDHGSLNTNYNINPNVLLHQEGLIQLDQSENVVNWKAYSQRAGGCSEIRLKDEGDEETYQKVYELLKKLKEDENSGVAKVLTKTELADRKAFPLASFAIIAKKGYEIVDNITTPYLTTEVRQAAQHGFDEDYDEMRAIFCLSGTNIPKGKMISDVELIDVAPTLASVMGFKLVQAEGKNVLE